MADNWMLKAVLTAVDRMSPVLKQVGGVAKKTRKYLSDVGKSAGNLSSHLGLPALAGGFFAGFGLAKIKDAMVGLADLEDQVSKFTATTGIAGSEYKKFQYLAQLSNVPFEALTGSMGKLNKQIGDAAAGKNKELAGLFKKLKIDTRGANGELRSAADMLPQLADAFQRNENPVIRARLGMALFGKSWQEIMPMLADGSTKMNERLARFRELGLEVKDLEAFDRQMESAGQFGDKLDDLSFVAKGFQNTIAAGLLPVITPLLDDLIKWVVVNKDLIAVEVKAFVSELAEELRNTDWRAVIEGVKDFASGVGKLIGWLGGTKNALIALVLFMNASAIMAFFEMGGAVLRLVGFLGGPLLGVLRTVWAVMMANPIGLLIAAIVGLALIIYQNWDSIVAYVEGAWERIKAVFDVGFFDGLIQLWLEGWQGMANAILGIIQTILPDSLMPDVVKNFKFTFAADRAGALAGVDRDVIARSTAAAAVKTQPDLQAANRAGVLAGVDRNVVFQTTSSRPTFLPPSGDRPSLVNASQIRASGQIEVNFKDAPPGTRVEQIKRGGDVPINTSVGYRSYALGMP